MKGLDLIINDFLNKYNCTILIPIHEEFFSKKYIIIKIIIKLANKIEIKNPNFIRIIIKKILENKFHEFYYYYKFLLSLIYENKINNKILLNKILFLEKTKLTSNDDKRLIKYLIKDFFKILLKENYSEKNKIIIITLIKTMFYVNNLNVNKIVNQLDFIINSKNKYLEDIIILLNKNFYMNDSYKEKLFKFLMNGKLRLINPEYNFYKLFGILENKIYENLYNIKNEENIIYIKNLLEYLLIVFNKKFYINFNTKKKEKENIILEMYINILYENDMSEEFLTNVYDQVDNIKDNYLSNSVTLILKEFS